VLGATTLLALPALSLAVVLIAAERPSFLSPVTRPGFFPAWLAGPLRGLWPALTRDTTKLQWLLSGLLASMYALYLVALVCAPRLRARWTIAAILAVHLIFLLSPPLSFTDVFNYVNYGRMGIVHHLNPYTTVPALEPHGDPSFALSNWHLLLSPYGPLFTLLTYALVPFGVATSFWLLKLLFALASLGSLVLLWKCAQLLGRSPLPAVAFVGLNPIVLVWGLGADHNDFLMVLFVMLALYLLLRASGRQATADCKESSPAQPSDSHKAISHLSHISPAPELAFGAGAALTTAVAIKASAAVLLPVFLLAQHWRRVLAGMALAGTVLAGASYAAFGAHIPDISTQSSLVTAVGLPNLLGFALGQGGETAALRLALSVLLVVTVLLCTVWAALVRRHWITAAAAIVLVLIVTLSWSAPWYIVWLLPLAALAPTSHLRTIAVVLGVYLILAFMPAEPRLARSVHFHPTTTLLGREHARQIDLLVR
jgi:hypothetical protein